MTLTINSYMTDYGNASIARILAASIGYMLAASGLAVSSVSTLFLLRDILLLGTSTVTVIMTNQDWAYIQTEMSLKKTLFIVMWFSAGTVARYIGVRLADERTIKGLEQYFYGQTQGEEHEHEH